MKFLKTSRYYNFTINYSTSQIILRKFAKDWHKKSSMLIELFLI